MEEVRKKITHSKTFRVVGMVLALLLCGFLLAPRELEEAIIDKILEVKKEIVEIVFMEEILEIPKYPPLDQAEYDRRIYALAGKEPPMDSDVDVEEGAAKPEENTNKSKKPELWPVKTVYPKDGAILPFYRVVAYYGNLLSKKMGVLGEYPEPEMLSMLEAEVAKWNKADPGTPVKPALHYIVSVAQASPGKDGMYRAHMSDREVEKVLAMAQKINAIVFLDIQVGLSSIQSELPKLDKYLMMEQVHLGIDPEFYMSYSGKKPGSVIGTMRAEDINFAIDYLAKVVNENNLPPKILVIHRFTQAMVTQYQSIKTVPEVQVVINMDGWGGQPNKLNTYRQFIYREPVQFTGFKLFYENDTKAEGSQILAPEQLLKLIPKPIYIQYQ